MDILALYNFRNEAQFMNDAVQPQGIRYEADEKPPTLLAFGLGIQLATLILGGIVFTPAIIVRAAGGTEDYLSWAVFAALVISGLTTILQAVRIGRLGAGYVLAMGTSGAFIAISVAALEKGGPGMLATLVVVAALFQFMLSARLSLLRRILTPTVAGTVIMLIPVTVMPLVFKILGDLPESAPVSAGPICAVMTLLVFTVLTLTTSGTLRLWAPVIGVIAGSIMAVFYGIFDMTGVSEASWLGFPKGTWPGLDFSFGPVFWALLPAFVFVTLVGAIETIGDSVAVQRVSWRKSRAVDFRAVQGAVAADGMGNLLSGLFGTVPNTTYSTGVSVTELTGVGSRQVGVMLGLVVIAIAFLPKFLALILAIPGPVVAAYLTVLLAMLFALGMKIVVQDGMNYRKALIVGVAFWLGVGFQNDLIFSNQFSGFARILLENGMTAGGMTAIVLTLVMESGAPRRYKLQVPFNISELTKIREFLANFASSQNWDDSMSYRLDAVAEETLLNILSHGKTSDTDKPDETHQTIQGSNASTFKLSTGKKTDASRNLLLTAYRDENNAILEFIVAPGEENLQDRIELLRERMDESNPEREISLRILRHLASSVHHQQYHDTDIVTVVVDSNLNPDD